MAIARQVITTLRSDGSDVPGNRKLTYKITDDSGSSAWWARRC